MASSSGSMFQKMAEFGPDSGGRMKGVTIVKPIVYGNVARYFGKEREEDGHTHEWTVYVKPYINEDMSAYEKKFQFRLHESYINFLRVVTKPPYEITETGYGEFEITIKIFFLDPNERPVTLYHLLKLFPSDTKAMLGEQKVVSEFYDEMIFQDPTALMQELLTTSCLLTLGTYKHETDSVVQEFDLNSELEDCVEWKKPKPKTYCMSEQLYVGPDTGDAGSPLVIQEGTFHYFQHLSLH